MSAARLNVDFYKWERTTTLLLEYNAVLTSLALQRIVSAIKKTGHDTRNLIRIVRDIVDQQPHELKTENAAILMDLWTSSTA